MKRYLTEVALKRIGMVVFEEVIFPAAREFVASTSNPYDDMALSFLKDFIRDALKEETAQVEGK